MPRLSIKDLDLKGERVFIRVDFNVPLDERGQVADDTRIRASLPTLEHALKEGARVILASHLGRPKGKADPKYSLCPVSLRLEELLGKKIIMAPDCVGEQIRSMAEALKPGEEVLLLENLRFHPGEEANEEGFCRELANLADLYVNDAFGTAHRAHASTQGMIRFVKAAAAGFLMQAELDYLSQALEAPERPFLTILGGVKVSDKIAVLENLLGKVDFLLIGGAMAYSFLKAQGVEVGNSRVEEDKLVFAADILKEAQERGVDLLLPVDHVAAREIKKGAEARVMKGKVEDGWMGLDIGPETIQLFTQTISKARTILWNGPLGVFEMEEFSRGSMEIARAVASSGVLTITGGGDTAAAVAQAGVADKITHVSTGGGASLELLEGKKLPGVEALER